MTENKVDKLLNKQKKIEVKYSEDSKNKTKEIKVQDPGVRIAYRIMNDFYAPGNRMKIGDAYGLVMDHTIVSPKMSYESLNNDLPDELKTKDIEETNDNGEKVTIHLKFPDYRTAMNILTAINKNDDSLDFEGEMELLNQNVIVDDKGKHVDWSYWDDGKGYGLSMIALKTSQKYLGEVLAKNGLMNVLAEALTFSTKRISRVEQ